MNSLKKTINQYIQKNKIMQLATNNKSSPWICTVNYVVDKDLNLYWMSLRSVRHSIEIINNQNVAVAIVVDPRNKLGLQMEGKAYEIKGNDLLNAHRLYCKQYGDKNERLIEAQSGKKEVRTYYKFTPNKIMIFDETKPSNTQRQSLIL